MTIRFIITPYDPKHWETTTCDLQIDVVNFKMRLIDNWKEAKVEATPKGGLLWTIPDSGSGQIYLS